VPGSGLWYWTRDTSAGWHGSTHIDYNLQVLDTYTVVTTDGTTHVGYAPDLP